MPITRNSYTLAALTLALVCSIVGAQPTTLSQACTSSLTTIIDCLSFVQTGSTETTPSTRCCQQLAALVQSNPSCLCELSNQRDGGGLNIDVTRALSIPRLCMIDVNLGSCPGALPPPVPPSPVPTMPVPTSPVPTTPVPILPVPTPSATSPPSPVLPPQAPVQAPPTPISLPNANAVPSPAVITPPSFPSESPPSGCD